jgi:hypothetical protein
MGQADALLGSNQAEEKVPGVDVGAVETSRVLLGPHDDAPGLAGEPLEHASTPRRHPVPLTVAT